MGVIAAQWPKVEQADVFARIEAQVRTIASRLVSPQAVRNAVRVMEEDREGYVWPYQWQGHYLSYGYSGFLLLFGEMDRQEPDAGWDRIAHEFLLALQEEIRETGVRSLGLWTGLSGLAFCVRAISREGTRYQTWLMQMDELLLQTYRPHLQEARERVAESLAAEDYDAIAGFAGIALYVLDAAGDAAKMRGFLEEVLEYLLMVSENKQVAGLEAPGWFLPERGFYDHGLAHGIPCVLTVLSLCLKKGIEVKGQRESILKIAGWLQAWKCADEHGVYWPARITWDEWLDGKLESVKYRDGWCYGTPGVAFSLWRAGEALAVAEWKETAVQSFLAIGRRAETEQQLKYPGFCHGYAGLLHMVQRMMFESGAAELQELRDRLLERLLGMYSEEAAFGYFDSLEKHSRHNPGLLEGAVGILLVLLSLLHEEEPEWDRVFLLR